MEIFFIITNVAVLVFISLILIYWIIAPILTVPFSRSTSEDIISLLEMAQLKETDKFIDLGSGDGSVVITASKFAGESVGVEHNPFLTIYARFNEFIRSNGKVEFLNTSFYDVDLTKYSVIYLYLSSTELKDLVTKLEEELAPGTKVISNKFQVPGWKPESIRKVEKKNPKHSYNYYLYCIGDHK